MILNKWLIIILIIGWFSITVIHSLQITKLKQFEVESWKRDLYQIEITAELLHMINKNKVVYW